VPLHRSNMPVMWLSLIVTTTVNLLRICSAWKVTIAVPFYLADTTGAMSLRSSSATYAIIGVVSNESQL
jgi:hypothetical protein